MLLLGLGQSGSSPSILTDRVDMTIVLSLMKLNDDYAGNAIRVRRDSDNAESDIGFSGTNLDTASLLSFVGAGNGYVKTIYDQSGNGRNVTQTVAGNQPQIVSSGSILTGSNGKPSIFFDNDTTRRLVTASTFSTPISATTFYVGKRNGVFGTSQLFAFGFYNYVELVYKANLEYIVYNSGGSPEILRALSLASINDSMWHRSRWDNTTKAYVIKTKLTSSTDNYSGNYVNGRGAETGHLELREAKIRFQELIILNADCGATDFAAIETDIQTRYSI